MTVFALTLSRLTFDRLVVNCGLRNELRKGTGFPRDMKLILKFEILVQAKGERRGVDTRSEPAFDQHPFLSKDKCFCKFVHA